MDQALELADVPEAIDPDELPRGEAGGRISTALPSDPKVAEDELGEVDRVLARLDAMRGRTLVLRRDTSYLNFA